MVRSLGVAAAAAAGAAGRTTGAGFALAGFAGAAAGGAGAGVGGAGAADWGAVWEAVPFPGASAALGQNSHPRIASTITANAPYSKKGFRGVTAGSSSSSRSNGSGFSTGRAGAEGRYVTGSALSTTLTTMGSCVGLTEGGIGGRAGAGAGSRTGVGAGAGGAAWAAGWPGFKALAIWASVQRRAKEFRIISANGAGMRLICASVAVSAFRWVKAWKRVVPMQATSSACPAGLVCRQSLRSLT